MSLTINGMLVRSMRWLAHWTGPWVAEVHFESELPIPLSGLAIILGATGILLSGTVDPDRSGTFGEKRFARVVGGGNGWGKSVKAQHYHSDIGLPLATIVSTTAAAAGEVAIVLTPAVVGTDLARLDTKPASQIFDEAGVDWWVGVDGITRVGKRIPLPAPLSLSVLDWDPSLGTVSFTCDELVEPGALVVDLRFGLRIVRAVEATVSGGSVTGTLWLVESAPDSGAMGELAGELAALARQATRPELSRVYEYRVIAMAGDRAMLQAVTTSDGIPDLLPASVWSGASGQKASLLPTSRVLCGFIAGDPKRPYVAAYEPPEGGGWRPTALELDAVATLSLGGEALAVVLGSPLTALPVARAPSIIVFVDALIAAITAAAAAISGGPPAVTSASLAPTVTAIATALGTAKAALVLNCPSTKVVSS